MDCAASQVPQDPAIYVARAQFAPLRSTAAIFRVIEDPADFAGREHGINLETGALLQQWLKPLGLELVAEGRRPPALPHHARPNGLPRLPLPH